MSLLICKHSNESLIIINQQTQGSDVANVNITLHKCERRVTKFVKLNQLAKHCA